MPGHQTKRFDPEQTLAPLHIAGLSARTSPSRMQSVQELVERLPGAEIHAVTEDGRMVITIEDANEARILASIAKISRFAGVLSLALAFSSSSEFQETPRAARNRHESSRPH